MFKLGIYLDNLGINQLAYSVITNTNKFLERNYKFDITIFYEDAVRTILPCNFSTMPSLELFGYRGTVIATSIDTAKNLISIPSIKNKFFYVYEIEWLTALNKNAEKILEIYKDENLKLISRSECYKQLLEKMWQKDVKIADDFDIERILEIVNE